jgi:hypothetical protein
MIFTRLYQWAKVPLVGGADTIDLILIVGILMAASVFWTRVLRDVGAE